MQRLVNPLRIIALISIVSFFLLSGTAPAQQIKRPASGSPVEIEADQLAFDSEREVYTARGNVVIVYGEGTLLADYVEYDQKNSEARAEGNARLKMGDDTLEGDRIVVNTESKTGVAHQSKAFYARNHFYISGERIEKSGEDTYVIDQPVATTCDGDNPDWELAGSRMKVTIDGYGFITHARFRAKGVPVVYVPVIAFPAKTTRQTGFLFPYASFSKTKDGLDIEVPFFWAINPQMDATFYQRFLEKRGYKQGAEFRYWMGHKSFGTFYGDYLEDRKEVVEDWTPELSRDWRDMKRRWSIYWNHQSNFDSQLQFRADVRKVSDRWYFRDFSSHNYYQDHFALDERDPFKKVPFRGDESLRYLDSSVRLSKGWDNVSVTALMHYTDDLSSLNNRFTLQRYPEFSITGSRMPVFKTPLYFKFSGVYDYFYREEGQHGHYAHIAPELSLPFALGPYAKVTPKLVVYESFWRRDEGKDRFTSDKDGVRSTYNASLAVSSTLSRIFDVGFFGWEKVRHEIKPEILYSYIPYVDQSDLPDYLPKLSPAIKPLESDGTNALEEQNAMAWALTNTFTARLAGADGEPSYQEFLRVKLFQTFDIREARRERTLDDSSRRPWSDMGLELDFKPHRYLSFSARNKYNSYAGWKQTNYDLKVSDKRGDEMAFRYRYTRDSLEQISFDAKAVITSFLDARVIISRDRFNDRDVEKTVGLTYKEQCWSVGVDYTRSWDDERVIFMLSLTGLGSIGGR